MGVCVVLEDIKKRESLVGVNPRALKRVCKSRTQRNLQQSQEKEAKQDYGSASHTQMFASQL